mgnify:CR=1 FL=1
MSTRWHYKVVEVKAAFLTLKPRQVEEALAPLDAQGWELVTVTHAPTTATLYLKKPA